VQNTNNNYLQESTDEERFFDDWKLMDIFALFNENWFYRKKIKNTETSDDPSDLNLTLFFDEI